MPPFGRNAFAVVAILAAGLIAGAWLLRTESAKHPVRDHASHDTELSSADVRTTRQFTRQNQSRARESHAEKPGAQPVTSGVTLLSVMPSPPALPPLTGYVVDSFQSWTTIPASYGSEGLTATNGTITLAAVDATTSPRFGQMISPPLPLKAPALAGPVANTPSLPTDASLTLEISLSEDGISWSPWTAVEKYTEPDGKRVTPQLQPTISQHELAAAGSAPESSPVSGPSLRYRLTLSASSSASPAIADIRIWKREPQ